MSTHNDAYWGLGFGLKSSSVLNYCSCHGDCFVTPSFWGTDKADKDIEEKVNCEEVESMVFKVITFSEQRSVCG